MYRWAMVFKRKSVNNKSRCNPKIDQNVGNRIQLSELKCSFTQGFSKHPASEVSQIPAETKFLQIPPVSTGACHDLSDPCQINKLSFIASASWCI